MATEPTVPAPEETQAQAQDLKVVVSVRGDKATIGVQRPMCDPFIVTFNGADQAKLERLLPKVLDIVADAYTRWAENPLHPKYERPAPPPKPKSAPATKGKKDKPAASPEPARQEVRTLQLF